MKSPIVSVIMATYNHADFVAQAIDSVLSQQGIDFEFLIADDGSTDRTRDVVASIQDERISFFPYEVNRGACIVTNELIQRAKGDFIALINSDDYWIGTDKLAYQYHLMQQNKKIDVCFGRARFVDKNSNNINKDEIPFGKVFDQENKTQGQWLRYFFDNGNCICHPTMFIRKQCYDEFGLYNNKLRQLPDFDMWIRLAKQCEIYISDQDLINFRLIPGGNASSQTTENSIRTINEHLLIADTFFDGINRQQLIDGFGELLVYDAIPNDEYLNIEKALLFFNHNQWLGKPYKMIGLLKMSRLLSDPAHYEILVESYGIDDKWFQQQMGEIDVLQPKIVASTGLTKSAFRRVWHMVFSHLF